MHKNLATVGAYGSVFGGHRCEVHVQLVSGVHVAHTFDVQADQAVVRDSGMEFLGSSKTAAFRQACTYLTDRYGHRTSRFVPAPLLARTVLTAWPLA